MTLGIVIFARTNSSRLPGKALKDFLGQPLITHIIDRALTINGNPGSVVLATSDMASDDELCSLVNSYYSNSVPIFRGSLDNTVNRAYNCALKYQFTRIMRICGDRPFFDTGLVSLFDQVWRESYPDIVTTHGLCKISGLTSELISTEMLVKLDEDTGLTPLDQEHLTTFAYKNHERFRIRYYDPCYTDAKLGLSLDTLSDYDRLSLCFDYLRDASPDQRQISSQAAITRISKTIGSAELL